MIFREKATTRIDDFGADGYMLLPALLKVLENAADHPLKTVCTALRGFWRNGVWS